MRGGDMGTWKKNTCVHSRKGARRVPSGPGRKGKMNFQLTNMTAGKRGPTGQGGRHLRRYGPGGDFLRERETKARMWPGPKVTPRGGKIELR